MSKFIFSAMLYFWASTFAWSQIPKLGADTSAKVTPADFARAKAEVANGTDLRGLWRSVKTIREGSPVTGAVKEQANQLIDEADKLATAGSSGEAYPLLMQGLSLLTDIPWTPQKEFKVSLALSVPTLVADQTQPLLVTLTQRFRVKSPSTGILRMRASLLEAPSRPLDPAPGADKPSRTVKVFWTNEIVSKDLIFDPLTTEVDISDVPEGRYLVKAEIFDGTVDNIVDSTGSLVAITTPVTIVRDLTGRAAQVERKLASVQGHDSAKASAHYPFNLVRAVNGWRRQTPDNVDLIAALKESETLADQLARGKDPLYQAKGDHKRHYWLAEAGEILPYRIHVPTSWDGKKKLPMVVNLHGGGGNEDSDFEDRIPGVPKFGDLAERFNVIVVSPSGYRPSGGYGAIYGATPVGRPGVWPSSPAKSVPELSELDALKVMDLVAQEYNVDRTRTYLVGNSMGGGGVWYLGSKYSERFAAIAPCASSMDLRAMPAFPFDRLKNVATIAVVGEFDEDIRKAVARYGVSELNKRGYTATLIEDKGGIHTNAWRRELESIFKFFMQYQKAS